MSDTFIKFIQTIFSPLSISDHEKKFLRQIRYAGGTYSEFAKILNENTKVEQNLLKIVTEVFKEKFKEPLTSSALALSLIGFIPARNLLSASMIKGVPAATQPNDPAITSALRFALESEKACRLGELLSPAYFVGGLVYDILFSLAANQQADPKSYSSEKIEAIWKHGLQVSNVACSFSKLFVPTLHLEADLCLDGLLHDIGKIVIDIVQPKADFNPDETHLADEIWFKESNEYSFSHDVYGFLVLWRLGFVADSGWITLCHHQPFLGFRQGELTRIRATLVWLADHVIRYKDHHKVSKIPQAQCEAWAKAVRLAIPDCKLDTIQNSIQSVSLK